MMVIVAILAVFVFLWILDWRVEHASDNDPLSEHASILLAPFFILVTFGQTIALFVDLSSIPWPPLLRKVMQWLSSLNINLELTRPECTTTFGPLEKTRFTLLVPVCLMCIVIVYALCKLGLIYYAAYRPDADANANADQVKASGTKRLFRRIFTIATTIFTTSSIFFVRNATRAFNCDSAATTGGGVATETRYMVVSLKHQPHY